MPWAMPWAMRGQCRRGAGRLQGLRWAEAAVNNPPGLFPGQLPPGSDSARFSLHEHTRPGVWEAISSLLPLGAEMDLVCPGGAKRPGLPGRELFALAAWPGPGAKTQSVLLQPFPRCRGGGVPGAGGMPGELQQRQVARWWPLPNAFCFRKATSQGAASRCGGVLSELAVQPGTNVPSGAAFVMCVEDARAELRVGPAAVERAVRARESRPESGSGLKERGPSRGARGPRGLGHWQMGENWAVTIMPFLFFPLCSCDCSATARQPTLRSP